LGGNAPTPFERIAAIPVSSVDPEANACSSTKSPIAALWPDWPGHRGARADDRHSVAPAAIVRRHGDDEPWIG
jgi:hypothetical protein